MSANVIKVSVLSSGELLLDGLPVALAELEHAMTQGAQAGAAVWYYRENAGGEAPPVAMDVMRMITANRLPVRLCTQPDFSDSLVAAPSPLEQAFAKLRERASQRQIAVLRADARFMSIPAPDRAAAPAEAVAAVEKMLPSSTQRNIAAIGDTGWTVNAPSIAAANQAIPFFGMLMGFATIGHAVWVFDASTPALLTAACGQADLLIVDSARIASLPQDWEGIAKKAMRGSQILVHDRATYKLRKP
jgi:hypothetical protein